jgi:hypothetical protein
VSEKLEIHSSGWKKRFLLIALPIIATFIMSAGIFISNIKIKGWIRIYGTRVYKPGKEGVFRVLARKGKHSKPVSNITVKTFLKQKDQKILIGQSNQSEDKIGEFKSVDIKVVFPPVKEGKYKVLFQINSDMGHESWEIPITLSNDGSELIKQYEENAGEENGSYDSMASSLGSEDKDGVIVTLHPINGRGFRNRGRDFLFIKAQKKSGEPVKIRASLKILSGTVRLPQSENCLPFIAGRKRLDCMVEFTDGEEIPFSLTTDDLGLGSMSLYPMSHGVSFQIKYQHMMKTGQWSVEKKTDFDVGSVENDAFAEFLPRIINPNEKFKLRVKGLGKGPLYLSLFDKNQWVKSWTIPLFNYHGNVVIDTKNLSGFYKLQYSLSYLPVVNTETGISLWIHPLHNDPEIIKKAIVLLEKTSGVDKTTLNYVSWINKKGLIWKTGYSVKSNIHFFAGIIDKYHYSQSILLDTKQHRISSIHRVKRQGHMTVFVLMSISGIALMFVIFFAVFLFLRQRDRSIKEMSQVIEALDIEENFFKNLEEEPDEIDSRRHAIAFGVIIALIVGFAIVSFIWLMLNIKWEM